MQEYKRQIAYLYAYERGEQLRAELHQHNYNYYVLNAPEISDKEFEEAEKKRRDSDIMNGGTGEEDDAAKLAIYCSMSGRRVFSS